ncbi:hypothetical protein CKM354_000792200 [Cercospora kikuchii]|uniref:Uncharacterized protein n=1 Tax=Cercospora kikuchii TaxID=84275 RepID=A0A9P3FET0_9PEZI|nr:uncharacterized protein CKM354_000792200 [Cercospora kikuchii]GIZ44731.1 hypothetical protein CKM354_000792200 [Cercospora kikuchii]
MFYTMYLSSVCQRRQWPEPHYEPYRTRSGWHCKVRVNNREYCTEVPYASEILARDGAAQKGYMICRNFSVNDGMGPGQRPGQTVQGLPVAIGTGRGGKRGSAASYDTASTDGTSSGGNSPRSTESGFEQQIRQVAQQVPKPSTQQPRRTKASTDGYMCYCQRAPVRAYGRCGWCLQESGWQ